MASALCIPHASFAPQELLSLPIQCCYEIRAQRRHVSLNCAIYVLSGPYRGVSCPEPGYQGRVWPDNEPCKRTYEEGRLVATAHKPGEKADLISYNNGLDRYG